MWPSWCQRICGLMSLFRKLLYAGVVVGLFNWFNRKKPPKELWDFDLQPGPWFKYYLSDWMEDHGVTETENAKSGIVTGAETGDYIWVTDTPEWDREWFNDKGFRFPRKWVPFSLMFAVIGEPGDPAKLPGL